MSYARALFLVLLCLMFNTAHAVLIPPTINPVTLFWDGGTSPTATQGPFCVQSFTGGFVFQTPRLYELTLTATDQPGNANSVLINSSDGTEVPVFLEWLDIPSGNLSVLGYNSVLANLNGGTNFLFIFQCDQTSGATTGPNAQLSVTVPSFALESVPNGTYSRDFRFTFVRSGSGETDFRDATVTLVRERREVRITQLSDAISFGSLLPGSPDAVRSSPLCVYSSTGGIYTVTATGSGLSGVPGGFALIGDNTNTELAYSVDVTDASNVVTSLQNGALVGPLTGRSTNDDCPGDADLNTLTITIGAMAVDTAIPDDYRDTLILVVEPN